MSVNINGKEYTGIKGLMIGAPIALLALLFTSTILLWLVLTVVSPLILIGLLIWWLA